MSTQADLITQSSVLPAEDYTPEGKFPSTPVEEVEVYHEAWVALTQKHSTLKNHGWNVCVLGQPARVWGWLGEDCRGMAALQGWNLRWVIVRTGCPEAQPRVEWMQRYQDLSLEIKRKKSEAKLKEHEGPLEHGWDVDSVCSNSDSEEERVSFWGCHYRPHVVY